MDLVYSILKKKYLRHKPIVLYLAAGGSQFWYGLKKVQHDFKWGATFKANDGKNIIFWEDVLLREVPLNLIFPDLA